MFHLYAYKAKDFTDYTSNLPHFPRLPNRPIGPEPFQLYTSWLSLSTFTIGLVTQWNLLGKVRLILPFVSRRDTNTPLSFGLHLGEELFPLGFAPDISQDTLSVLIAS
jgi:hypothetical protein